MNEAVIIMASARANSASWEYPVHGPIMAHYILAFGTEEQKARWLPAMASGEIVGALAMTVPSTGPDLQRIRTRAERDGNGYRLSGQKTFVSDGRHADLILVATRTDPAQGARGLSLFMVETNSTAATLKKSGCMRPIHRSCSLTMSRSRRRTSWAGPKGKVFTR